MIDYDPIFRAVNIGMVQGTWQLPTLTSFNLLFDYRRTPTLQLTNALIAEPDTSLSSLIQRDGVDAVRAQAKTLTPVTKQTLAGVTQQVTPQWQLGLDARWSSLSGTPPYGARYLVRRRRAAYGPIMRRRSAAASRRGRTSCSMNVSVLTGKQLKAQQLGFDYRFSPVEQLTLEPVVRWYWQTDKLGVRLTRVSPGFRVSYRIRDRLSIEAQIDYERTRTSGNLTEDLTDRYLWYIGWRWDF